MSKEKLSTAEKLLKKKSSVRPFLARLFGITICLSYASRFLLPPILKAITGTDVDVSGAINTEAFSVFAGGYLGGHLISREKTKNGATK